MLATMWCMPVSDVSRSSNIDVDIIIAAVA
jgi:hypothetical protein